MSRKITEIKIFRKSLTEIEIDLKLYILTHTHTYSQEKKLKLSTQQRLKSFAVKQLSHIVSVE